MKTNMLFVILMGTITGAQGLDLSVADSIRVQQRAAKERKEEPRKRFISVNFLKGITTLEFAPPGVIFHRTLVLGNHSVSDDGFHFVPLTKKPERLPQENFNRHFWYNSLVKELYVPYSEIRSVRTWGGIIIKTNSGMRFKVHMKHYRKVADDIRRKMNK